MKVIGKSHTKRKLPNIFYINIFVGARCFPIPDGIEIYHLKEEIEATDMTAKEAVMSVDVERAKLEKEAEELNDILADESSEDTEEAMDRLTQVIR